MFVATIGGVLGVLVYLTAPQLMFNTDNIWISLGIGIVSGFSSTGTNQLVKQMIGGK